MEAFTAKHANDMATEINQELLKPVLEKVREAASLGKYSVRITKDEIPFHSSQDVKDTEKFSNEMEKLGFSVSIYTREGIDIRF